MKKHFFLLLCLACFTACAYLSQDPPQHPPLRSGSPAVPMVHH